MDDTISPEPWNVVKCGCGHPSCKRYGTDNGVFPDGAGYSLADAQLAAASRDLLEALVRIEKLATLFSAGELLPEGESFDAWLEQARAAIAKAVSQ